VIEACLEALFKMAPDAHAVLVDNASSDRTVAVAARFEQVTIIRNTSNRGFAAGANQGIREAQTDQVLLLNPDVELRTPLCDLEDACHLSGLAAGLLTDDSGAGQTGFAIRRLPTPAALVFELLGLNRLWPRNPVNRRYRCLDLDFSKSADVDQPAGAFLMIQKTVWNRLGGFDERFHPLWFEDVDFCKRAAQAGYKIRFVPGVRAAHKGGHSVNRLSAGRKATLWYGSLLRYAAKHFWGLGYRVVCLAAVLSCFPRMLGAVAVERSLSPATYYSSVFLFSIKHLLGRHGAHGTES
jgi:N-acetylglucosaminyl-diphospho-decaprenol L-rhamnosyltransferase